MNPIQMLFLFWFAEHCLHWAVRKFGSLKKEQYTNGENLEVKATEKFKKYFITKPKNLLDNFPVKESPDTWKPPRRPPKIIEFDSNSSQQKSVISLIGNAIILYSIPSLNTSFFEFYFVQIATKIDYGR